MIELKHITNTPHEVIALDEVGRSPLSGPVVIGALRLVVTDLDAFATLLRSFRRQKVKDSKLLNHEARKEILEKLKISLLPYREKGTFSWKGIELEFLTWEMDQSVIDTENIFQASMRGMKEAAQSLSIYKNESTTLLIDGHVKLKWQQEGPLPWKEIAIIKGDVKSPLIGLAAIIAKERRDAYMREMHELYPHYGFNTNFGYPTSAHRRAIAEFGPCPIHRKTFAKVKEFVGQV